MLGRGHYTAAILLAGGSGSRMGSDTTKQMMTLAGKPLILHSLLAMEESDYIDEVILVAKADEVELYPAMLEEYGAVLTVADLQEILSIGRNSAYELIRSGTVKAFRVNKKNWRISKESVLAYLGQWKTKA